MAERLAFPLKQGFFVGERRESLHSSLEHQLSRVQEVFPECCSYVAEIRELEPDFVPQHLTGKVQAQPRAAQRDMSASLQLSALGLHRELRQETAKLVEWIGGLGVLPEDGGYTIEDRPRVLEIVKRKIKNVDAFWQLLVEEVERSGVDVV